MSCPLFCVRVGQMPMWLEKSEKRRVKRSGCFARIKIHLQSVGTALAAVRNPQKLVATASRREGVYNRAGEPSVIFAEKEELHSECETAKGCCERYGANDDVP